MKKSEITVGSHYVAKVSGRLTTVRVDTIRETESYRAHQPHTPTTRYDVTNLATGRKTTFRSAAKFRRAMPFDAVQNAERTPEGKIKMIDIQTVELRMANIQQAEDEKRALALYGV